MLPSLPFSNSKVTKFPFKLSKKHGLNRETLCHCTTTTPPCHCKSMLLPPLMFFYSRITKFSFHTCQQPRGLDRETSRHHTISPPQVCISVDLLFAPPHIHRKIESLGWGCFCGNQVSKKEGSKRYSLPTGTQTGQNDRQAGEANYSRQPHHEFTVHKHDTTTKKKQ
ncbi:hypothetical protein GLYMA_14G057800v4 [Glycine max]|nr:hypothetical protein GLYMA_14G057800v4 [Glycine max]